MKLDLFNNLFNNVKENNVVKNFIKELSDFLEKKNNNLKQENCLYQVIEIDGDGVYLQNVNNNKVCRETDIKKELLDKIGNDTILSYKNGEYVIEEEMTKEFFDSLVDIKEYKKIQEDFIKESNILEIDSNTKYKIQKFGKDYKILQYGNEGENTIKVPNALIPFFANENTELYYKNGKFNRNV